MDSIDTIAFITMYDSESMSESRYSTPTKPRVVNVPDAPVKKASEVVANNNVHYYAKRLFVNLTDVDSPN